LGKIVREIAVVRAIDNTLEAFQTMPDVKATGNFLTAQAVNWCACIEVEFYAFILQAY